MPTRARARSNSSSARKAGAAGAVLEAGAARIIPRATRGAGTWAGRAVPEMDLSSEEVREYWLDFCKRHEVGKDVVAKGVARINADPDYWADHTMWELLEALAEPGAKRK